MYKVEEEREEKRSFSFISLLIKINTMPDKFQLTHNWAKMFKIVMA
jgi:hypothetical protein